MTNQPHNVADPSRFRYYDEPRKPIEREVCPRCGKRVPILRREGNWAGYAPHKVMGRASKFCVSA